jgi:hypothetical protein
MLVRYRATGATVLPFVILILAGVVNAQNVYVSASSGQDYNGCGDESSPCATLYFGGLNCPTNANPCTLMLQPGYYSGYDNSDINFGTTSVTIENADPTGEVILDGESSNLGFKGSASLTLNGLTVQNYRHSAFTWVGTQNGCSITVTNCAFIGNQATGNGGAFSVSDVTSFDINSNVQFINNIAHGTEVSPGSPIFGFGGAVYLGCSKNSQHCSLQINDKNVQFINNIAQSVGNGVTANSRGGAVYVHNEYPDVSVNFAENVTFVGNKAIANVENSGIGINPVSISQGGAIYILNEANGARVSVSIQTNSQFLNNIATATASTDLVETQSHGGAIYFENSGDFATLNIKIHESATFLGNNVTGLSRSTPAQSYGGAIYFLNSGNRIYSAALNIKSNALFAMNSALGVADNANSEANGYGGAIYVTNTGSTLQEIAFSFGQNTQFRNNTAIGILKDDGVNAFGYGGAMYVVNDVKSASIILSFGDDTEFSYNSAVGLAQSDRSKEDGYGGCIYFFNTGNLPPKNLGVTFGANLQFVGNEASSRGGVAFVESTSFTFSLVSGYNATFQGNQAHEGSVYYLTASLGATIVSTVGANTKFSSNGDSGIRVSFSRSNGSLSFEENSYIQETKSFLSVSMFDQSRYEILLSDMTAVNCSNCIDTESMDFSAVALTILNSRFLGINKYAISLTSVTTLVSEELVQVKVRNSSFVGTPGANAIQGTASNRASISMEVSDSNFTSFSSDADGGAVQFIAVAQSYTNLTFSKCLFQNVKALGGTNGGAVASTCFRSTCAATVDLSHFIDTSANLGGALSMLNDGGSICTMSIANSEFKNCVASSGGGAIFSNRLQTLSVLNSSFLGNAVMQAGTSTSGGAILVQGPSTKTGIVRCFFRGNSAGSGGAVAITAAVDAKVQASSFIENSALSGNGGAIEMTGEGSSLMLYDDCALQQNEAKQFGGAIYITGTPNRANETIHVGLFDTQCQDNAALNGGCIFADEHVDVSLNSEFVASGNSADYGGDVAAPLLQNGGAKLLSQPTYDAPYCVRVSKAHIVAASGIDVSDTFSFEFVDVHGNIVETVDTPFLVLLVSNNTQLTIGGASMTVEKKAGTLHFSTVTFTSMTLEATSVGFEVTPALTPSCNTMPTISVSFTECPATYYLDSKLGNCVQCPSGQYKLVDGSSVCATCAFGGSCMNGTMHANSGYWCETVDVTVSGRQVQSCISESRLYKCSSPGCLGGDMGAAQDKTSFAVSCNEKDGYTGLLCAECKEGYVALDNRCVECSLNALAVIDAFVSLLLIVVLVYYTLLNAGGGNTLLALTLFYFQNMILLIVSFEGFTFGMLDNIFEAIGLSRVILLPLSFGLSLATFSGVVLSIAGPPLTRLALRSDFKTFSWFQLSIAGVLGNVSLVLVCFSVGLTISALPNNFRIILLVIALLLLLPILILVIGIFLLLTVMVAIHRPLPVADLKSVAVLAISFLSIAATLSGSLFAVFYNLNIRERLFLPTITSRLSFPILTFVLPSVANLDLSAAIVELTQTCETPWDYYIRLLAGLFNPILLLTVLWLGFPFSALLKWALAVLQEKTPSYPLVEKIHDSVCERTDLKKFAVASLELLLRSFTTYTTTAVGFFACRYVGDQGWYLNQENSIECYSWERNPKWVLFAPLAFLGVMYAVVLLPAIYAVLLTVARFRKAWIEGKTVIGYLQSRRAGMAVVECLIWIGDTFTFQMDAMHPYAYYWPVTIVLRRIFIVVVYVWLVQGDFHVAGAVMLGIFYLVFVPVRDAVNPFVMRTYNFMEVISHIFLGVCAIFYVLASMTLLYKDTDSDAYYRGIADVIHLIFWPTALIPIFTAIALWILNLRPSRSKTSDNESYTNNDENTIQISSKGFEKIRLEDDSLTESLLTTENDDMYL